MTPEELLKPRYIMIASYPDCGKDKLYVGKIIEFTHFDEASGQWYNDNGKSKIYDAFYEGYPHLFKKLEWWENRPPNLLPKYVKANDKISKTVGMISSHCLFTLDNQGGNYNWKDVLPSTEEEYNNQNQKS